MSECGNVREKLPFLLTESVDPSSRESAHLHIESCAACADEWSSFRQTWDVLGSLSDVEVPSRVRDRVLAAVAPAAVANDVNDVNVIPFQRRPAVRWLAQAAAVVLVAGGSYFAGHRTAPVQLAPQPATVAAVQPVSTRQPIYSIAETRVLDADAVSPNIEGRPSIQNVQFVESVNNSKQIGLAFDITSHVTVTGNPTDKSMVRLLSYVLQSEDNVSPSRSRTIDWVRKTYAQSATTDPEIAQALAKVLRSDEHEGVRIKAIDTINTLPARVTASGDLTRDALIDALKSDPNPAVRIKAVEALARLAGSGQQLAADEVDTLRQKAAQDDENLYVRVKAAEALSKIRPE